ncbi:hypothetical protein BC938DRAFT_476172 [Jimgerdemannia flammicorona]|uniref:Uncharacterized protein n=1 Tax=Jimgerdemannia flammicorona TaxID=994334 RepID=A0A433QZB3_9FUNG|nr:hypothetical protein BC938DRAFT_476172 [Jimgerdemannia flammicorona]
MSTLGGLSSPYPGYEVLAAARNAEEDDSEASEDVDEKTTAKYQRSGMAPAEDELSPSMSNTEKYLGHSETKQYRFNKRSLDDYHQTNMSISTKKLRDEEIDETEVLDSGDGSMSPCEAVVKEKKERELRQEIMTSGLPAKPARTNLDAFAKVFRDMLDNQKWRLSTGKVIEDALFEFGMRCNEEQ